MTVTFEPSFRATAQGATKEVKPTINTRGPNHELCDNTSFGGSQFIPDAGI